ncbi:MAG: hypothetical protein KJ788_11835 [Gammaproteobacteria bacterium]|nr:hypothetical protein [Gammaproteobacteria bacterium]
MQSPIMFQTERGIRFSALATSSFSPIFPQLHRYPATVCEDGKMQHRQWRCFARVAHGLAMRDEIAANMIHGLRQSSLMDGKT